MYLIYIALEINFGWFCIEEKRYYLLKMNFFFKLNMQLLQLGIFFQKY